jgi:hypothetical protein
VPGVVLDLVLGHLGKLHPVEHALVYLLAFGPFVLLAVTIRASRRRQAREDRQDAGQPGPAAVGDRESESAG